MAILQHPNISDRVYEILSQQIINHKLKPGSRLREKQLAEQFGVSRTPLRDALNRLAQDGFVTIEPRKGASIKEFNIDDVREVYDIRMALEGLAARLAATKPDIRQLEKLKAQFVKSDTRTLLRADTDLHDLVVSSSGYKKLEGILNNIYNLIQAFRAAGYASKKRSTKASSDHLKIIKAIMDHDQEAAENLMRNHIEKTKQEILRNITGGEQKQ